MSCTRCTWPRCSDCWPRRPTRLTIARPLRPVQCLSWSSPSQPGPLPPPLPASLTFPGTPVLGRLSGHAFLAHVPAPRRPAAAASLLSRPRWCSHMTKTEKRDPEATYNKMSLEGLVGLGGEGGFDFKAW